MSFLPEPVELRSSTVMSSSELCDWLQVGKNALPRIVRHYQIPEITGSSRAHRYGLNVVVKRILGVQMGPDSNLPLLLCPLQKVRWVADYTGMSESAINDALRQNRLHLPAPIALVSPVQGREVQPRRRRWIPAQVEAYVAGMPLPFLAEQLHEPSQSVRPAEASRNVFAAICTSSDRTSP